MVVLELWPLLGRLILFCEPTSTTCHGDEWHSTAIILQLLLGVMGVTGLSGADLWSVSFSFPGRQAMSVLSLQHLLDRHRHRVLWDIWRSVNLS